MHCLERGANGGELCLVAVNPSAKTGKIIRKFVTGDQHPAKR
jgi:hypothetical protein